MKLLIERACAKDAAILSETRSRSFYDDYVKFGECPGYHTPVSAMRESIEACFVFKMIVDGEIIGDISTHEINPGVYWIGCLEVIPEFQNQGVGSQAIHFILNQFSRAKTWRLDTPVQNFRNCCFYEKLGFVKVEDRIHSEKLTLRIYEKQV